MRNIRDKKRRNYAACATAMDDSIGQVVDLYKEHGNVSLDVIAINEFHTRQEFQKLRFLIFFWTWS